MAPCPYSLGGPAVLPRAVQSRVDSQAPHAESVRDLLSARGAPDFIHGSQGPVNLDAQSERGQGHAGTPVCGLGMGTTKMF